MSTKKDKLKKGYMRCPDCNKQYKIGAPHTMFCEAHTCSECGTSFKYALPIWDSRVTPPERRCEDCTLDSLDSEEEGEE
jgi:DNA-directed RNA polymerase subunit RPC12/RpoP